MPGRGVGRRSAGWAAMLATWEVPGPSFKVAALYVVGLLASVAGLVYSPFSDLLLIVLIAWLVPFFVFAIVVIVLTYGYFAVALYRWSVRQRGAAKAFTGPKPDATTGMWDPWLDG